MPNKIRSDIKDASLTLEGAKKIEWAASHMPVLRLIKKRFQTEKPFKNIRIGACLHVTSETANLVLTLKEAGALISLCACNPLSTQDDVAASLVHDFSIPVYAKKGEDEKTYYRHIDEVLDFQPQITMDDGGDLIFALHTKRPGQIKDIIGSNEETTTGDITTKTI